MTRAILQTAKALLLKHEGLRLKPYQCTAGKLTIGVGRNLESRGITESEAMHLLANDIMQTYRELGEKLPWFRTLDDTRQLALVDMAFNLGVDGLLRFKRMLAYLHVKDYAKAAAEALDSLWAKQVGARALTIADMISTGVLRNVKT